MGRNGRVALCEEGVDRNVPEGGEDVQDAIVALCEEGVDRNATSKLEPAPSLAGRPLRRGRG